MTHLNTPLVKKIVRLRLEMGILHYFLLPFFFLVCLIFSILLPVENCHISILQNIHQWNVVPYEAWKKKKRCSVLQWRSLNIRVWRPKVKYVDKVKRGGLSSCAGDLTAPPHSRQCDVHRTTTMTLHLTVVCTLYLESNNFKFTLLAFFFDDKFKC